MKSPRWEYLGKIDNHMTHYRKQYGVLANMYKRQTKQALLKMVPMSGKTVVEIGCGNGFLGEIANELGIKITYGTDFTRSLLKYAKSKYKNVKYADVEKRLPFKNNSIDVILLPEVIAHLKNRKKALFEMNRILKKGGYLIISMPDKKYLDMINYAKIIIKGSSIRKPKQYFEPMYFNELETLITSNGFNVIKHYKTFHQSRQILLAQKI